MKEDSMLVILRACPSMCRSAIGYPSKLEMVAATAKSLVAAMIELKSPVQFVVILDGCDEKYVELYESAVASIPDISLEIIRTDKIGNAATWNLQVEIAQRQRYTSKYVFFVEDDYLFAQNALVAMSDFLNSGIGDFVSPLDHPDRYRSGSENGKRTEIVVTRFGHWRKVNNTCMTFMMRRDLVPKILAQSSMYKYNCSDGAFWALLLKDGICNPLTWIMATWALARYALNRNYCSSYLTYVHIALRQGIRPLFYRKYTLWSPIPTLSVHISVLSLPLGSEKYFEEGKVRDEVRGVLLEYLLK